MLYLKLRVCGCFSLHVYTQILTHAPTLDGTVVGQKVTERSILEEGADPVTLADITAQQIIEGSLRHYYPNVKLVGEEDIDPKDFRIVPCVISITNICHSTRFNERNFQGQQKLISNPVIHSFWLRS